MCEEILVKIHSFQYTLVLNCKLAVTVMHVIDVFYHCRQLKHHWLNDDASVCVFVRDVGDSIDYRDLHRDRDTGPSHEYYRALFETNNIKPTPKVSDRCRKRINCKKCNP